MFCYRFMLYFMEGINVDILYIV